MTRDRPRWPSPALSLPLSDMAHQRPTHIAIPQPNPFPDDSALDVDSPRATATTPTGRIAFARPSFRSHSRTLRDVEHAALPSPDTERPPIPTPGQVGQTTPLPTIPLIVLSIVRIIVVSCTTWRLTRVRRCSVNSCLPMSPPLFSCSWSKVVFIIISSCLYHYAHSMTGFFDGTKTDAEVGYWTGILGTCFPSLVEYRPHLPKYRSSS